MMFRLMHEECLEDYTETNMSYVNAVVECISAVFGIFCVLRNLLLEVTFLIF